MKGSITSYIDVAQVALYLFWIFFAGLILYLHREGKREGYPLESDRSDKIIVQGFPGVPPPKTYLLPHNGGAQSVPRKHVDMPLNAQPAAGFPGAPLTPNGNPMLQGVGPGSYSDRADVADVTAFGLARIVPMRAAPGYHIESRDPDPRGMAVRGADGRQGGTVVDVWVDRSEALIRYLEVSVPVAAAGAGAAASTKKVLLPMTFARVDGRHREVRVKSILANQFVDVPTTRSADTVTRREEDRICGYYGGGYLYAWPNRAEPIL